jgi:hypothetical protein
MGTTKRDDRDQMGVIADVAVGLVSAGYRISSTAACEILNLLGKRSDYADPTLQRQVQADMTDRRVRNKYKAGEYANKINSLSQDAAVVNCCESNDNWLNYGAAYHFYIVSNWAEKNFLKRPTLKAKIESFGEDPTSAFSKIFVQAVRDGTVNDPELFGPAHPTAQPQPDPKSTPIQCVIFAMRKNYATKRGLDSYHGDNAFNDVIAKSEAYLDTWIDRLKIKARTTPVPPPVLAPPPVTAPSPITPPVPPPVFSFGAKPAGEKRKEPSSNSSIQSDIIGRAADPKPATGKQEIAKRPKAVVEDVEDIDDDDDISPNQEGMRGYAAAVRSLEKKDDDDMDETNDFT